MSSIQLTSFKTKQHNRQSLSIPAYQQGLTPELSVWLYSRTSAGLVAIHDQLTSVLMSGGARVSQTQKTSELHNCLQQDDTACLTQYARQKSNFGAKNSVSSVASFCSHSLWHKGLGHVMSVPLAHYNHFLRVVSVMYKSTYIKKITRLSPRSNM